MSLTEALAYLDRLVTSSDDVELCDAVNRVQDSLKDRDRNTAEMARQLEQAESDYAQLSDQLDAALARQA